MSSFLVRPTTVLAAWLVLGGPAQAQSAASASPTPPLSADCVSLAPAGAAVPETTPVDRVVTCAYEFSDASDHETATRLFAQAVDTGRHRHDMKGLARALNASANERSEFGDGTDAEALLVESADVAQASGDVNGMARAASSLGSLRTSQGRYEESRVLHLRSLDLWTGLDLKSGIATALNNVGGAYRALGDFATAFDYFQQSLDRLEQQGDRRRSATVLDNMGIVARRLGDYEQGLALAQRGLAIRESFQDRGGIAKSLDSLSEVYSAQGNWGAALAALGKSLDIRRELGLSHATAEALNNIAVVYQAQGSYEQAIRSLNQALALNREKVGSGSLTAEIQTHLGEVFLLEGQFTRSTRILRESVAATEAAGYREQAAAAHAALGRTLAAARQLTAARAAFDRSLELRDQLGDRGGRAAVLVELADLDRRQRRLTDGRTRAEDAVRLAAALEMPDVQWRALTLLGRLQLAVGATVDTRSSFDAAIALVEDIRGRNPGSEDTRSRFFADRLAPFQERIALAVSEGRTAEALVFAERSKARALLDVLRDNRGPAATALTDNERTAERALRRALNSASAELELAARSRVPDDVRVRRLRQLRDGTRLEYEAFQSRLYADHPALQVSRAELPGVSATDAQRLLPDRTSALVEFVVGDTRTVAIVVTRAGVRAVTLPVGRTSLAAQVRGFRTQLDQRDLRADAAARALHAALLAPLHASLAAITDLIIIPDGVLWELPFQALRSADGRYLIEDAAVSYAPSVMVLREMMRLRTTAAQPRSLLAVGNPSVAGSAPLPDAETEVRAIARLYGPSSLVLTGAGAREERWKREAPNYRVLHLAAHGLLDDASPMYSSLQLTPSGTAGGDDGRLEAWELMAVPLKAELVVFSACETARGRVAPGEGVIGLMWAAFVAGSQASLVSQWQVDSQSSAALMVAFHRAWRGNGAAPMSKARALQAASLAVLRTPGLSHPFHWAGFILSGDAR